MKDYSEIQCPNCGGKIFIDGKLLIRGGSFSCSNKRCDASVALSHSSHQVASHAMREFEQLKQSQL
jgi:DNA-directed RNA polymerase subunit RPC12/RpoP